MGDQVIEYRRVGIAEAPAFRALRLVALRDHPADFGSDYATMAARPLSVFVEQLADSHVMGAYVDGVLAGIAGVQFHGNVKERHRGYIWGVYAKGRGVARGMLVAALTVAFARVSQVELGVRVGNEAAEALYRGLGFVACGGLPGVHLVEGVLYDDRAMVLDRAGWAIVDK